AFARVLTSPLQRARRTCELAGFADRAEIDPDLVEWNYGDYEGRKTAEIRQGRPDWQLFRDGCPGGESVAAIGARADRVVAPRGAGGGAVLLSPSGHSLRAPAARWGGGGGAAGRALFPPPAPFCARGYDHPTAERAARLWNDDRHVAG